MIDYLTRMPPFCGTSPDMLHGQGSERGAMDVVCTSRLTAYALSPNGSETVVFERPSLLRELKCMKDEGLLEIKNHVITIRYTPGGGDLP